MINAHMNEKKKIGYCLSVGQVVADVCVFPVVEEEMLVEMMQLLTLWRHDAGCSWQGPSFSASLPLLLSVYSYGKTTPPWSHAYLCNSWCYILYFFFLLATNILWYCEKTCLCDILWILYKQKLFWNNKKQEQILLINHVYIFLSADYTYLLFLKINLKFTWKYVFEHIRNAYFITRLQCFKIIITY